MAAIRVSFSAGALFALIFVNASYAQVSCNFCGGIWPTVFPVQGNGQLICDGCGGAAYSSFDDLVVFVVDWNGNPVSNATVTWTATGQGAPIAGQLDHATTVTGSDTSSEAALCDRIGHSCNRYSGGDTAGLTLRTVNVAATLSNGNGVQFALTETPAASPSTLDNAQVTVLDPPADTLFSETSFIGSGAIHVSVVTSGGKPIPGVSVTLVPEAGNPPGGPTATCTGNEIDGIPTPVVTDRTGTATCTVFPGPVFSTGQPPVPVYFRVLVGGVVSPQFAANVQLGGGSPVGFAEPASGRFRLTFVPLPPPFRIVSGNYQTASPGQTFAQPLVVGLASDPSPVTWSVSPSGAATVAPASLTTDFSGQVSATVALAKSATGIVQVTATTTAYGESVTFNLSAYGQVTGLTIGSGNNQSVPVGQLFQPVTVLVAAGAQSPEGVPVQFTVSSGPATLAQPSANANANGRAAVGVQAGNSTGAVTVVATAGGFSVTFNLTVQAPAFTLTSANFLNGAGYFATGDKNVGALSPCSIGTLVIDGLPFDAAAVRAPPNLFSAAIQRPLGYSIIFNPQATTPDPAPILGLVNSGATLITFQVPCDLAPGPVPVSVTAGNATALVNLDIRSASPGIFELPMSDGYPRAMAVRPDGTFVDIFNPARRGEIVRLYITGIGPMSPPLATNALPDPGADSVSTAAYIAVQVGSSDVPVLSSSRASRSLIGVYELAFQIPADTPTGDDVFLEVGVLVTNPGDYQFAQPSVGSSIPIQ